MKNWTRRNVLALGGGLGLPSLSGCSWLFGGAVPEIARRRPAIDVHCHVFNAADLPVPGFVRYVVVGDEQDQIVFPVPPAEQESLTGSLAALLTGILSSAAPTAREESDAIRRGIRVDMSAAEKRSRDRRRLEELLLEIEAPMPEPPRPGGGTAPQPARPGAPAGRGPNESTTPAAPPGLLMDMIRREIRQTRPDVQALESSEEVAEGLLLSDGPIGRVVQWAFRLLEPRRVLFDDIDRFYGGAGGVFLFTPALIDFSHWLDSQPRSSLAEQIEVMDLIQRNRISGAMFHSFAPFDPWRQIADEQAGRHPNALELVQHAVLEAGFIGVKLYPPMGFLPANNRTSGLSYPERARDHGMNFPALLDDALDRLYAWCAREGVPILAHANHSNGSTKGYARRAHPDNWAPVLRRYRDLRLNLGHFGDFGEAASDDAAETTWEWAIGRLLSSGAPNLFADMSYMNELLGGDATAPQRDRMRRFLQRYARTFDPRLTRLLYGSDWIMLGREKGHADYLAAMHDFIATTGVEAAGIENFFHGNAIRHLGLREGGPARRRLEAYYRRHGLDRDRLRIFDRPPTAGG